MKIKLFTIPNLLTLSNLLCGSFAAVAALAYDNLSLAFGLIVLAAVFDFLDGFAARLLHQSSPIGLQLDSLADDITFGFAPAAVLYTLYGRMEAHLLPEAAWIPFVVFLFAACAALRLARFNIDDTQRDEFLGLPSPAAALFCASLGWLNESYGELFSRESVLIAALGMGVLMLVGVRMFALKFHGFGWRGNELRYLFLAACAVAVALLRLGAVPVVVVSYAVVSAALLLWLGGLAVPFIILLYIVISLVRSAVCRRAEAGDLHN